MRFGLIIEDHSENRFSGFGGSEKISRRNEKKLLGCIRWAWSEGYTGLFHIEITRANLNT